MARNHLRADAEASAQGLVEQRPPVCVESAGGFVEQQQDGIVRGCAGECESLQHAA